MKKARIMLMSIAVLATVGTALAFKVNHKGTTKYCFLQTTVNPGTGAGVCPTQITGTAQSGTTAIYYTTLTADDCDAQAGCTNQAASFGD